MNPNIEIFRKISLAYSAVCKPFCKELDLPQTAFDILMFLGNNPAYKTARDIVEIRYIKANLVSIHVDRLVHEGYLIRRSVKGDRRKTELVCTDKAQPVIERGRKLQNSFIENLLANADSNMRNVFYDVMCMVEESLDAILEEE